MARAVSVRLDDEAMRALSLLEAQGLTRSKAIRAALVEAAANRRRRDQLRAEVAALAADAADREEKAEIMALMDEISPPWPPQ